MENQEVQSAVGDKLLAVFEKSDSPVVTWRLPCCSCEKETTAAAALLFDAYGEPQSFRFSANGLRWDRCAERHPFTAEFDGGGWYVKCRRCLERDHGVMDEGTRNTEVYSRVVGYYRPIKGWNAGKRQEFEQRKYHRIDSTREKMLAGLVGKGEI